eukprot:SAG11_NODE_14762_length_600_cov_1.512974_1_plen_81_part_01
MRDRSRQADRLRVQLACYLAIISSSAQYACSAVQSDAATAPAGECKVEDLTPGQRDQLSQRWAENGLGEHASVASFARFTV